MTSSIGWIDFSSEHRDRVHTGLDLMAEKGIVDELVTSRQVRALLRLVSGPDSEFNSPSSS